VLGAVGGKGAGNHSARLVGGNGAILVDTTSRPSNARVTRIAVRRNGRTRRASTRSADYPRRPFAGPFDRIRVSGLASKGRSRIRTDHEIRQSGMTLRWAAGAPRGRRIEMVAYLPVWDPDVEVRAQLRDGTVKRLRRGDDSVKVADVALLRFDSGKTAWTASVPTAPKGASLRLVAVGGRAKGAGAKRAIRITGKVREGRGRISVRYTFPPK
jgi:hypothetical protein